MKKISVLQGLILMMIISVFSSVPAYAQCPILTFTPIGTNTCSWNIKGNIPPGFNFYQFLIEVQTNTPPTIINYPVSWSVTVYPSSPGIYAVRWKTPTPMSGVSNLNFGDISFSPCDLTSSTVTTAFSLDPLNPIWTCQQSYQIPLARCGCPQLEFKPIPTTCCYAIKLISAGTSVCPNAIKIDFTCPAGVTPGFMIDPGLSGWTYTLTGTGNYSLELHGAALSTNPPVVLGKMCFDNNFYPPLTVIQATNSFSIDNGVTWKCFETGDYFTAKTCVPAPCAGVITSMDVACGCATATNFVYDFSLGISLPNGSAVNSFVTTSSCGGTVSQLFTSPTLISGKVEIPPLAFQPQPAGCVIGYTITYTLPGGTICTMQGSFIIPSCTPECPPIPGFSNISCTSNSGGVYTYDFDLDIYSGSCGCDLWPGNFKLSLEYIYENSIPGFYVNATSSSPVPLLSTANPAGPYFKLTQCPKRHSNHKRDMENHLSTGNGDLSGAWV